MRKWRLGKYIRLAALLVGVVVLHVGAGTVLAQTSSSDNFQATDMQFGSGSTIESCSDQYCAKASIGDLVTGSGTNGTSSAMFGSTTDSEPMLEVIIERGESSFGTLTTERTATSTSVVKVRSHLSEGYSLQVMGDPPKIDEHTLKTSSTPVASIMGTEMFGMNAVANSLPQVGADPVQIPSEDTSFGQVTAAYGTPNLFKYVSGDTIATSQTESGRTDYTISMIVNVSNNTPAGHYSTDFAFIVIPVY